MSEDAAELRELVAAMRELGVTRYQKGGILIELGAQERGQAPRLTENEKAAMRARSADYVESILYASSEGFPIEEAGRPADQ